MNENLTRAIRVFRQHFEPAYTLQESDEQLTTTEVYEKLLKLTLSAEITPEVVHDLLIESGFTYDYIIDEYRWLFKAIH